MLTMAVGQTDAFDTVDAVGELLAQCRVGLRGVRPDAGLLFASHDVDVVELAEAVRGTFPGIALIGATTLAPLTSQAGYTEAATSLTLFAAPRLRFVTGCGRRLSIDPVAAVRSAVRRGREHLEGDVALCIVLTRVEGVRGLAMITALREELGPGVPVFGGGALGEVGDHYEWHGSLQVQGEQVFDDAVVLLLVSGPLSVSVGVAHGWRPVGQQGVVTRAEGSTVYDIDGQPVQEFYRRYLHGDSGFPLALPLAITDPDTGRTVLRGAVNYESEGPVEFQDRMPEGATVSIMLASADDILAGAAAAVRNAREGWHGDEPPQGAITVCCAARNMLLGGRVSEELDVIRRELPPGTPLAGAYVGGEIGTDGGAALGLHSHTCATLLLGV